MKKLTCANPLSKAFIFLFLLSFFSSVSMWSQTALADLQIYPTRLIIEGRARSGSFNLRHLGSKTTRYRISPVFYRMNPEGVLEKVKVPSPDDRYAADMVIFSPRMVVLEPGKEQVVRLQVRRPPNLEDGEYRLHLQFETFDDADGEEVAKSSDPEKGVNMSLKAHRAIAVPVLVYQGNVTADVRLELSDSDKEKGTNTLLMRKSGNRSVFGNVKAEYQQDGKWELVSEIRGVAIYGDQRVLQIPVDYSKIPKGADLRISYNEETPRGINSTIVIPQLK